MRHRVGAARQLEGVIDAAARQVAHLFDAVRVARADRVRRADAERHFEPRRLAVDRDDRLRAGESRAQHAGQTDAAQADDRNRVVRRGCARC